MSAGAAGGSESDGKRKIAEVSSAASSSSVAADDQSLPVVVLIQPEHSRTPMWSAQFHQFTAGALAEALRKRWIHKFPERQAEIDTPQLDPKKQKQETLAVSGELLPEPLRHMAQLNIKNSPTIDDLIPNGDDDEDEDGEKRDDDDEDDQQDPVTAVERSVIVRQVYRGFVIAEDRSNLGSIESPEQQRICERLASLPALVKEDATDASSSSDASSKQVYSLVSWSQEAGGFMDHLQLEVRGESELRRKLLTISDYPQPIVATADMTLLDLCHEALKRVTGEIEGCDDDGMAVLIAGEVAISTILENEE